MPPQKPLGSVKGALYEAEPHPKGMRMEGNIDIAHRPSVWNPQAKGYSSVWSTSFGTDKGEVLVPRITPDGKILSEKEALERYRKTGQHLGIFDSIADANAYAEALHLQQARTIPPPPGNAMADFNPNAGPLGSAAPEAAPHQSFLGRLGSALGHIAPYVAGGTLGAFTGSPEMAALVPGTSGHKALLDAIQYKQQQEQAKTALTEAQTKEASATGDLREAQAGEVGKVKPAGEPDLKDPLVRMERFKQLAPALGLDPNSPEFQTEARKYVLNEPTLKPGTEHKTPMLFVPANLKPGDPVHPVQGYADPIKGGYFTADGKPLGSDLVPYHAPSAANQPVSPDAIQGMMDYAEATGSLPPLGLGQQTRIPFYEKLHQEPQAVGKIAQQHMIYTANTQALGQLTRLSSTLDAAEQTAGRNLQMFLGTAKNVVDSGSPWLNKPLRAVDTGGLGSKEMAAYNAAYTVVLPELARVLVNLGSAGMLSDHAREEVQKALQPNATLEQIYAASHVLEQDMRNRRESYDAQRQALVEGMRQHTTALGAPAAHAAGTPTPAAGASSNDPLGIR
jgi:hypothetical protein